MVRHYASNFYSRLQIWRRSWGSKVITVYKPRHYTARKKHRYRPLQEESIISWATLWPHRFDRFSTQANQNVCDPRSLLWHLNSWEKTRSILFQSCSDDIGCFDAGHGEASVKISQSDMVQHSQEAGTLDLCPGWKEHPDNTFRCLDRTVKSSIITNMNKSKMSSHLLYRQRFTVRIQNSNGFFMFSAYISHNNHSVSTGGTL